MDDPGKAVRRGLIGDAVLIAGPTASGKSAAALALAEREGRVVVNADSMQVYGVLDVLTARPSADDLARAPHRLYGHVPPSRSYSVGAWTQDVRRLLDDGVFANHPPIFVGGTGLYFRALCEGISAIPLIPLSIRTHCRDRLRDEGAGRLHDTLAQADPRAAAALQPSDGQRIARALEVWHATGRSILDWQTSGSQPLVDISEARKFVIEPERSALSARIDARFDAMLRDGAMDEVRRFSALGLDLAMPAMKAIGVRELMAAQRGETSLEEAAVMAKAASRQLAKRQATWFRHQLGDGWLRMRHPRDVDALTG